MSCCANPVLAGNLPCRSCGAGRTWIGVDLDGTLAEHYWPEKGPFDPLRIGEPVPAMVERVKAWLAQGIQVRIMTARVDDELRRWNHQGTVVDLETRKRIEAWTLEHIGTALRATNAKDYGMLELWDDRARRVIADQGVPCCETP